MPIHKKNMNKNKNGRKMPLNIFRPFILKKNELLIF